MRRFLCSLGLIGCLLAGGCEDAEKKARYVKAPLETGDVTTRTSLNQAHAEARTRLLSVHGNALRADLSRELDQTYARALAAIEEVERQRTAESEGQAELVRAAAAAADADHRRKLAEEQAAKELAAKESAAKESAAKELAADEQAANDAPAGKGLAGRPERQSATVSDYKELTKTAVAGLQVGVRNSALGDGTKVLVLRNPTPYPASFDLRCYTRNDAAQKSFSMIIPAGGEKHIGFLQGWCGNFKDGEHCEAYVDGERMWRYEVPLF